ncbi:MAG: T9SS type A sorting domain-containing protein [Bacteroidia bacterium]
MNTKILWSLVLLLMYSSTLLAQYGGGEDDGFGIGKTVGKSALSGESMAVMFGGGQNDGFACNKAIGKSALSGESLSVMFGGGQDDGFACNSMVAKSSLGGESMAQLYGGGQDDGFACDRMIAKSALSGESMAAIYGGGLDDGFACDKLDARTSLTGESMAQLYGGGENDGFACDKLPARTAITGESMAQLYGGGQNDGFACDGSAGVPITPLSLNMIRFDAIAQPASVMLLWTSAEEQNNHYFSIERSIDGSSFELLGTVLSQGDSHDEQHYSFGDYDPLDGVSWYRLRWTDFDGESFLSSPRKVLFENTGNAQFSIYPNPLSGTRLHIQLFEMQHSESLEIAILDAHGRRVLTQRSPSFSAEGRTTIDLDRPLASGTYLVQILTKKGFISRRLLILGI